MHFLIKLTLTGMLGALSPTLTLSQGTIRIDSFPQNLQLYQRGTDNLAQVAITGKAPTPYVQLTLKVLRNAALYSYQKQQIGVNRTFSFYPSIRAEAVEYAFLLYAFTSLTDSILINKSERIVCGDVLILHGQSNMMALHDLYKYEVDDRFLRNYTFPYLSTNIPNELSWSTAKEPYGTVGGIGLWLQKLILEKYGIPTAAINGGVGGTSVAGLSNRDPSNHANLNTYYGLLLYRAQRAGLADKAKIIVYKQGEADAALNTDHYDDALRKLTDQFEEDYPAVKKIYVSQLNIISDPMPRGGEVRDAQRRARQQGSLIETIATVGSPYYDGVHYLMPGNQQIATELFRQIARDSYGATDTVQINSPDIKTALYNTQRDTITLTFDDQMRMVWPKDTTLYNVQKGTQYTRRMIDFIYLDGKAGAITSGFARRNQIILALREPSSAQTITYLPPFYSDDNSPFYDGVHLKNERGLRAFSFDKFALAVTGAPKLAQTISTSIAGITTTSDMPFALVASSSSKLPVKFQVISGPGLLLNSHQLKQLGVGVVTVKFTQAGDERYLPAIDVVQSISIARGEQYIGDLKMERIGQVAYSLSATAVSSLPVTYEVVSGPATVTGTTLTSSDYGQITLRLLQAGDANFFSTVSMRTICLNPEKPIISTDPTAAQVVLVSSSPFRNQWSMNGDTLRDETSQKLTVSQAGTYVVRTTNPVAACNVSEQSDPKKLIILATEPVAAGSKLHVYPNPATDQVLVRFDAGSFSQAPVLQIMDESGQLVQDQLLLKPVSAGYETTLSVRSLKSGVYLLRATNKSKQVVVRLLVCP